MGDDPTIRWELASPFGILVSEDADAWYSGHVNDVLELPSGPVLIATEKGGVWSIAPSGTAAPLSDSWPNPDVNCLAPGPDDPNAHFFAGCTRAVIRETDLSEKLPLLSWRPVNDPLPAAAGDVHRIVVIRALRRIIAACDGGLFWSRIPATTSNPGCLFPFGSKPGPRPPYQWKQAMVTDAPPGGFWDVAVGATTDRSTRSDLENPRVITVVAGGFYGGGIFVGQWDASNTLVLSRAALAFDDGTDASHLLKTFGTTSVSACEVRPTVLYAASAWPDGRLNSVMRSTDGGRHWVFCPSHLDGAPSPLAILASVAEGQGASWNNCIAASPTNPAMAAVGWASAAFLTLDAGKNWKTIAGSPHLHRDVHGLRFTPTAPAEHHGLYIGSDGGLARVDLDAFLAKEPEPYRSNYNRLLPTHQCYATYVARQFYGTLSASPREPGLIATGVQDNANIYCQIVPEPTPWIKIDSSGDGGWTGFLNDGNLLRNIMGRPVGAAAAAGPVLTDLGVLPIGDPPTNPIGPNGPVGDVVRRPSFKNPSGQRLLAIVASGSAIFGCYGNVQSPSPPPYHWEPIATLPPDDPQNPYAGISAVGAFDGGTIHVGTAGGRMFVVDTKLGSVLELPVALPKPYPSSVRKGGQVNRIVAFSETDVFAMMNGATATVPGPGGPPSPPVTITSYYILKLGAFQWTVTQGTGLPSEPFFGLETVAERESRVPHGLFVSTDDRVYISRDDGANWQQASLGLPRNPHCADLRFVSTGAGAWLYLSTFGRSVYVVRLRQP